MPPDEKERSLEAEVAGLSSRVDAVQESLEKNNEATAGIREDVARLRGEINGTLPRIDRNVEKLFEELHERDEFMRVCQERTGVHGNEIAGIRKALRCKANKAANDEAHARLWFFIRVSLFAIAVGAVGMLLARAFEF